MAVILAAAMLIAQVLPVPGDVGTQEALPQPSDDASVETPEETPPQVETAPAPPVVAVRGVWLRLAQCESSGRWHVNTGNGYYGGLQQDMTFWRRHGGTQYASRPDLASMEQQVAVAEVGLKVQGFGAWPVCSRRLGLR